MKTYLQLLEESLPEPNHPRRSVWREYALNGERRAGSIIMALRSRFALPSRVVLDLGCGDGGLTVALARAGAVVVAVDKSHAAARRARARLNDSALPGIVTTASAFLLPLATESVDAILATDLIEHVAEPAVMLYEISRVLKPGGVCLISAAHRWSWENIVADPHWGLTGVGLMPRWLGQFYVCRVRRRASYYDVWRLPTRSDIENVMRKAGLFPVDDACQSRRFHSPASVVQVWAAKPAGDQVQPMATRNLA